MAIKSSGKLSFNLDIASEFSDGKPHRLEEFYKGGNRVPNLDSNSGVPTSGEIKFSNFYNKTRYIKNSTSVPGLNTRHFNAGADDPAASASWKFYRVRMKTVTSSFAKTTFKMPQSIVSIQGDEDEGTYDNDHNGIRNPGFMILHSDGTEIGRVRGSGTNADDDGGYTDVTVPALNLTTTKTGTFYIYYIADCFMGGASNNNWINSAVNLTWETT